MGQHGAGGAAASLGPSFKEKEHWESAWRCAHTLPCPLPPCCVPDGSITAFITLCTQRIHRHSHRVVSPMGPSSPSLCRQLGPSLPSLRCVPSGPICGCPTSPIHRHGLGRAQPSAAQRAFDLELTDQWISWSPWRGSSGGPALLQCLPSAPVSTWAQRSHSGSGGTCPSPSSSPPVPFAPFGEGQCGCSHLSQMPP